MRLPVFFILLAAAALLHASEEGEGEEGGYLWRKNSLCGIYGKYSLSGTVCSPSSGCIDGIVGSAKFFEHAKKCYVTFLFSVFENIVCDTMTLEDRTEYTAAYGSGTYLDSVLALYNGAGLVFGWNGCCLNAQYNNGNFQLTPGGDDVYIHPATTCVALKLADSCALASDKC
jgi:hypothetical protein